MKSHISIIYAKTNSFTAEKITVGLIYFSEKEAHIVFSEQKLKLVEQLKTSVVSDFIRTNFILFKNKIEELDAQLKKNQKNSILTEEYFDYLNRYSQGLLLFDKLKPINMNFEEADKNKIFLKMLGENGMAA